MRQRPTLPGRLQPSTIGVLRLNFCVRNGNRWNPQAITTAMGEQCNALSCNRYYSTAPGKCEWVAEKKLPFFSAACPGRCRPAIRPDFHTTFCVFVTFVKQFHKIVKFAIAKHGNCIIMVTT